MNHVIKSTVAGLALFLLIALGTLLVDCALNKGWAAEQTYTKEQVQNYVNEAYRQGSEEGIKAFQEFLGKVFVANCGDKSHPSGTNILFTYDGKTYEMQCTVAPIQEM